ncbi:hypothetical protein AGJ34_20770 [Cronobacter dublinensis subsp. dublinensis]|nr:hypothetical protein [Cronobacter dublinensis subsp. dublinensis]EGT5729698.1 hypothetical protein [Cronobacter dublinensis subsp. dublinensis]
MKFNVYPNHPYKGKLSKFSILTAAFFRTFVAVPCFFFFFVLAALSYSANGVGNLVTYYIENLDYNPKDHTYQICLDEPPKPQIPAEGESVSETFSKMNKLEAEQLIQPAHKEIPVCEKYGWVSSTIMSSRITNFLMSIYVTVVMLYLITAFLLKRFSDRR